MSLGERIQTYRKKSNLSQEALGEKLIVSRQTISLWEKDKTMPTVDNLVRLAEIFSISVENLITECKDSEAEEEREADEHAETFVDEVAWRRIIGGLCAAKKNRIFAFIIASIVLLIYVCGLEATPMLLGFTCGIIIIGAVVLIKIFKAEKLRLSALGRSVVGCKYVYEVFEQTLEIKIWRDDALVRTLTVPLCEVEKITILQSHFLIWYGGVFYIVKRDAVGENSVFLSMKTKRENVSTSRLWRGLFSALALLWQISFFVYVPAVLIGKGLLSGEGGEEAWFAMLGALVFITIAEVFGLVDAILLLKNKRGAYSKVYLVAVLVNAVFCMSLLFYEPGATVFCFVIYGALFGMRIYNLVRLISEWRRERRCA